MKIKMYTVEETIGIILDSLFTTGRELVSLKQAAGRVLSGDVVAGISIPPFDNSAMDGFALVSADTAGANPDRPVRLQISGEIQAGGVGDSPAALERGRTIRIMTGAAIPPGADTVIPVEETDEQGGHLILSRPCQRGENIRRKGEDISRGTVALNAGARLKSADIGLLASLNCAEVEVGKRPVVSVISTGNEIVEVGDPAREDQIRNSNAYLLLAEIEKYGAIPRYLGIAGDSIDDTVPLLRQAGESDVIITTGGVSMGKYDFVNEAVQSLGFTHLVEKVKMKPGKPCVFARREGTLFFGLPGNPVSTLVSFIQFVRPALLRMMGAVKIEKPVISATVKNRISKKPDRKHFIRGYFSIVDGRPVVDTTGPQGSGILRSMSIANCLIVLPIGSTGVNPGDQVSIQLIDHEEM